MKREELVALKNEAHRGKIKHMTISGIASFVVGLALSLAGDHMYRAGAHRMGELLIDDLIKNAEEPRE